MAIQAAPGLPEISFSTASGNKARLAVAIEASDTQRQRGLMGVTSLPADQGQIFIFQDVAPNQDIGIAFWMKDTPLPLSIAFISADGRVLNIQDMQPDSLQIHSSPQPYRYAVEANQGWFARHGVGVDASVDLSDVFTRLALQQTAAPTGSTP